MEHYAGIDVSLELSSVCVVDAQGKIVREVKVASEPEQKRELGDVTILGDLTSPGPLQKACTHKSGLMSASVQTRPKCWGATNRRFVPGGDIGSSI